MNAAVGHMDCSALMVIGVSAWYPDTVEACAVHSTRDWTTCWKHVGWTIEFSRNWVHTKLLIWNFVSLYFENIPDTQITHYNCNSKHNVRFKLELKQTNCFNCFPFISIESCTKMPILPTLSTTGKFEWLMESFPHFLSQNYFNLQTNFLFILYVLFVA